MSRLSICIPTYNRAAVLPATIETILAQTYGDFELVVVDNRSTDGTEEAVRGIRDPRIRYVRNPRNVGLVGNHNRCIEEARGELIAIYHDHDLYGPDLVQSSLELLDGNPGAGMVCCGVHIVDPDRPDRILMTAIERWPSLVPGRTLRARLLHHWRSPIPAPTVMVRRTCYERVGGFRAEFGLACDRELWLRILRHWDLGYLALPLARLRNTVVRRPYDTAKAAALWRAVEAHLAIQKTHVDADCEGRPLHRPIERGRLSMTLRYEFWKQALWAIARGESEVSRGALEFCREHDMSGSRFVLAHLQNFRLAGIALGGAVGVYERMIVAAGRQ